MTRVFFLVTSGEEKATGPFVLTIPNALFSVGRIMPRTARVTPGGMVFHVLNRAVGRRRLFDKEGDYDAFERIIAETLDKCPAGGPDAALGVWVAEQQEAC